MVHGEEEPAANSTGSIAACQPHLAGAHGTPVFSQDPHLPIVLQSSFVGAVTGARGPSGAQAVEASH